MKIQERKKNLRIDEVANNVGCCRGYRLLLLRRVKKYVSKSWE